MREVMRGVSKVLERRTPSQERSGERGTHLEDLVDGLALGIPHGAELGSSEAADGRAWDVAGNLRREKGDVMCRSKVLALPTPQEGDEAELCDSQSPRSHPHPHPSMSRRASDGSLQASAYPQTRSQRRARHRADHTRPRTQDSRGRRPSRRRSQSRRMRRRHCRCARKRVSRRAGDRRRLDGSSRRGCSRRRRRLGIRRWRLCA